MRQARGAAAVCEELWRVYRRGTGAAPISSNATSIASSSAVPIAAHATTSSVASAVIAATLRLAVEATLSSSVVATAILALVTSIHATCCPVALHAPGRADGVLSQDELLRSHHPKRIHAGALPHLLRSDWST